MIQRNHLRLAALASLTALTGLRGATHSALVDLLVANGVITAEQASSLEVSASAKADAALVALLVSNGAITPAQAQGLQRAAPPPAPAPVAAPAADKPADVVKPKEKAVTGLTVSGRIHAQMDYLSTDYDAAVDPDDAFNLFLRRIYLGAKASFAEGISGTVNGNFGNDAAGVSELEKAIVSIELSSEVSLDVGYQKVPFAFEETTSSSKIPAVERSIATRYFTEQLDYGARHTGLFLSGDYDNGLNFSVAVTNPAQSHVASSSATDNLASWGRLGWEGEIEGVDFAFGINGGIIPDQRAADTTDRVWGAYASARFDPIALSLEYLAGSLEDAGGGRDATPAALHLIGIVKLAPTLELVGRAALIEADGGVGADISSTFRRAPENGSAKYDSVTAYYIGGNWSIRGNSLKLSAGYEWAEYTDNLTGTQGDAIVAGLRTRLQFLF